VSSGAAIHKVLRTTALRPKPYLRGRSVDFNNLRWTDAQKLAASMRAQSVHGQAPFLNPELTLWLPPLDSRAFEANPPLYTRYPAPGAVAIPILTYTAPPGKFAVINKLAIAHIGGNPPDGTGNVVWSVQINGGGQKGLGQITFQFGTLAQPNDIVIPLMENDVCQVFVQVPTGQPAMPPGTATAALFHGWTLPLSEAILPLRYR